MPQATPIEARAILRRLNRKALAKRIAFYEQQVQQQKDWIKAHGDSIERYVEHYGSQADAVHYGDGGEAIYEADYNALVRYEDELVFAKSLYGERETREVEARR